MGGGATMPYADVADVVWPVMAGNLGFLLAPVGWHRMVYVRRPGSMDWALGGAAGPVSVTKPGKQPSGRSQHESLILAQNERWRHA